MGTRNLVSNLSRIPIWFDKSSVSAVCNFKKMFSHFFHLLREQNHFTMVNSSGEIFQHLTATKNMQFQLKILVQVVIVHSL